MKLQKIKRIFFNWLKYKGVYDAYKLARHNTNHLVGERHRINPYYRRSLINPRDFITDSFTWRLTREGHNFWNDISFDWRDYLKKIKTDSRYQ